MGVAESAAVGASHRIAAMLGLVPYVEAAAPLDPPTVSVGASSTGLGTFTVPTRAAVGKIEALRIPTLQRAHDLIVALVSGLPLVPYRERWNPDTGRLDLEPVQPLPWHVRPDPAITRQAFLGAIASDLWAYGRAYMRITSRYAARPGIPEDWPATFRWMPYEYVQVTRPADADPALHLPPGSTVTYAGARVPLRDVIELRSPTVGVCEAGQEAIATAAALNSAARRFANVEMPSGWLRQVDGEPMDGDALSELAAAWTAARQANTTGALNQLVEFHESTYDPDRLQLVESRQYQALELARVGNVPPYLVGAPTGTGMTYQNAQQARSDLVDFGAAPIIAAIGQAFSGPQVTPAGQGVWLDTAAWLAGNPYAAPADPRPTPGRPALEVPQP
jgi:Phage portal protein